MARILIIDDEETMRAMMGVLLRRAGHTVIEACTARQALEAHRSDPADLIVTDMVMHEMDGTELLRRLSVFSPQTPVVGISGGYHGNMYLNMAKMLGAECVLAKPFKAEEFMGAIDDALGAAERVAG